MMGWVKKEPEEMTKEVVQVNVLSGEGVTKELDKIRPCLVKYFQENIDEINKIFADGKGQWKDRRNLYDEAVKKQLKQNMKKTQLKLLFH